MFAKAFLQQSPNIIRVISVLHQQYPASFAVPDESPKKNFLGFDSDFADAISKPLPQWYLEGKRDRERLIRELELNRERIIAEFKAKYEVSEQEKLAEKQRRMDRVKLRLTKTGRRQNWISSLFGPKVPLSDRIDEQAEDILSTKDKWDAFWKEEEQQTGLQFPSILEVFPELNFKWPTWSKKPDGTAVECERDEDCPFPQACCPHPIVPGVKFCCTGWGQRVMVPNYAYQQIQQTPSAKRNEDEDVEDTPRDQGQWSRRPFTQR